MSEIKSNCFVIMPFSRSSEEHTEGYWTKHFNELLKPTIEELGVKTFRVEAMREDILKSIIQSLVTSPIVVADLTDHNPNVFWELGVRQSFRQNTITIAEEGTKLPFDVSPKATIFYNLHSEENINQFKINLKTAINDCFTNPEKSDSHVLDSITGRGSLYELIRMDDARRRIEALIVEAQSNQENFEMRKKLVGEPDDLSEIPFPVSFGIWRTKCMEFLLVNRYLDEDERFYKTAEATLRFLENLQLHGPWLSIMSEKDKDSALRFYTGQLGKFITRALQIWIDLLNRIYHKIVERMKTMISDTGFKTIGELRSISYGIDKPYGGFIDL
ncbi:MAG: hypothetical protein EAX91_11600 [Candidatus Lokiarchaeota archaeon]|nr:hypothetical protein [Candidatus Lokiarchaeota archaeon]